MGEYAIRKSDGERIKIGTCEEMYYLRYEDLDKITPEAYSLDPREYVTELRFRLPFPDEDSVLPGEYDPYNRGQRLYRSVGVGSQYSVDDFSDPSTVESPGIMQLRHEDSGLLLNVPCYHGQKLPDVVAPMKAFWNGKGHSFELSSLRPQRVDGKLLVYPVVRCRHCHEAWRYEWADIWEYVPMPLRAALRVYAEPKNEVAA